MKRKWRKRNIGLYAANYMENDNRNKGGRKVALAIYKRMYGKQNPAVHR